MSYLKAKMHKNRFRLGFRARPRWSSSHTALPQTSSLDLRGPTAKGREDRNTGRGRKGRRRGERGRRKGR